MANVSDLVAEVAAVVPLAPNPTIRRQVIDTYYEFCRETRVWQGELLPFTTVVGEKIVYLASLAQGNVRIYDIVSLGIGLAGHRRRKPLEAGDFHRAVQLNLSQEGMPRLFDQLPSDQLILYPTPNNEYVITGEAVMVPRKTSDIIEQWIYDDFGFGLRHGVIYALCSMQGKTWTDMNQAADSIGHFTREIDNAKARAENKHQSKDRVVQYGGL